MTDIYPRTFH